MTSLHASNLDELAADGQAVPSRLGAGPASLVASTLGTFLVLAVVLAGPDTGTVNGWPVMPIAPGLVGLLLLPVKGLRAVGVGLASTLTLPLLYLALGLAARVTG